MFPPAPTPIVQDRTQKPAGLLPRQLQSWVVLGIALLMTGIIALSGWSQPSPKKPTVPLGPTPLEPSDTRIQDYRKRVDEEARRLAAARAELDAAQRELAAAPARTSNGQGIPASPSPAPAPATAVAQERAQREYKALFADNIALSVRASVKSAGSESASANRIPAAAEAPVSGAASSPSAPPAKAADILTEGTIIEAVLTNRLDGTFAGPVNAMVTTAVYTSDRARIVIPQGARLLGEATPVNGLGQQRLAVAFHRLVLPSGRTVTLDQFKGLSQVGETGLKDQVDHHYAQLFGASLAIGALGGLAQINTRAGLDATGTDLYRQGVAATAGQSSMHVLDRFLNVLPTVTIREGQRVKVYLAADLSIPVEGEDR